MRRLLLLRFPAAAVAFFLPLRLRFPVAAAALGTGDCFFNLYTTIFGRNFLLPISCMFLIYISIAVRYRLSESLVCAQPKRLFQYFDRFLSTLRFELCTGCKTIPFVPNRAAVRHMPPASRFLPEPPWLYYTICQFWSAGCRQGSCLNYLFSILSPVGGKGHHDTLTNSRIREAAASQRKAPA